MDTQRNALVLLFLMMATEAHARGTEQSNKVAPPETKAIAHIRFYDKDWGDGHNFCTVAIDKVPYTSTGNFFDCTNDEAQSVRLQDLPPGTTIALYDDPHCGDSDDYSIIRITKLMPNILVKNFGTAVHYTDWNMSVHRVNGIQGKVSCAEVDVPGPNPAHVKIPVGESPAK
jgi:hypothetical protein